MSVGLIVGISIGGALSIVLLVLLARPKRPFATQALVPGVPFELAVTVPHDGTARVWLYYDVAAPVEQRRTRRALMAYVGLDGQVLVGDVLRATIAVHLGEACEPAKRTPVMSFGAVQVTLSNPGHAHETVALAKIPNLTRGQVLVIRGVATAGAETQPRTLELRVSA